MNMHSWSEIVEVIQDIENDIFGEKAKKVQEYRQFGHWIIQNKSWPFQILKTVHNIPGLQVTPTLNPKLWKGQINAKDWGSIAGPFLGWHLGFRMEASLRTDAFYLHQYLVSIYNSEQLVAKTGIYVGARKMIIREAENLMWLHSNIMKGSGNVYIPKILTSKLDRQYPFFVQNLISGRTIMETLFPLEKRLKVINRWLNVMEKVLVFLWDVYETYGISLKPLNEVYPKLYELNDLSLEIEGRLDYECRKEILCTFESAKQIIEKNMLLPCSFIHNDLSSKNIIIDQNKIWLIDWGSSKLGAIIEDQDNIIEMSAGNKYLLRLVYQKMNQSAGAKVYSIQEQQFLNKVNLIFSLLRTNESHKLKKINYSKRISSYYSLESRIKEEVNKCNKMLKVI